MTILLYLGADTVIDDGAIQLAKIDRSIDISIIDSNPSRSSKNESALIEKPTATSSVGFSDYVQLLKAIG